MYLSFSYSNQNSGLIIHNKRYSYRKGCNIVFPCVYISLGNHELRYSWREHEVTLKMHITKEKYVLAY